MTDIRNHDGVSQVLDFSNLKYGSTDVDAFTEWRGEAFIFTEAKRGDAPLPRGQQVALENVCDALQDAGKESIVFVVRHNTRPPATVDLAQTEVIRYRYKKQWRTPRKRGTLYTYQKQFLEEVVNGTNKTKSFSQV